MLWRSCASLRSVKLTLIRHATLRVEVAGHTLLVDPQLDPAGARAGRAQHAEPAQQPARRAPAARRGRRRRASTACSLTHLHADHFDETAKRLIPHDLPVFCQPQDAERCTPPASSTRGPCTATRKFGELLIVRTEGRHGTGEIGEKMAPGQRLRARRARRAARLHRRRHDPLRRGAAAVAEHRPDVIVVNAGAARFNAGRPDRDGQRRRARARAGVPTRSSSRCTSRRSRTARETRAALRARSEAHHRVPSRRTARGVSRRRRGA